MKSKNSFTLVELMIVIAILAILSAIVIFTLNPSRLFDNFRDTRRVTDISSIHKAISFMESWNTGGVNYGDNMTVYLSLPDASSTCSNYALPTLATGYTYACKPTSTYKNTDGTGWIPIDFTVSNRNRYITSLPVDPVNDSAYFYSYFPGGSYELIARLKNSNNDSINDGGFYDDAYELGSPNRTNYTPIPKNFIKNGDVSLGLTHYNIFTLIETADTYSPPNALKYIGNNFGYYSLQNDFIKYDPNKEYRLSGWMKSVGSGGLSRILYVLNAYDKNFIQVDPRAGAHNTNTQTSLRETLNTGDTRIKLSSTANWYIPENTPNKYQLCVNIYNTPGYTGYTYTRSFYCNNTYGYYTSIDGNDLVLYQPYSGSTVLAGTLVAQPKAWGGPAGIGADATVPTAWTYYSRVFYGVGNNWSAFPGLPYGTVYVKPAIWIQIGQDNSYSFLLDDLVFEKIN